MASTIDTGVRVRSATSPTSQMLSAFSIVTDDTQAKMQPFAIGFQPPPVPRRRTGFPVPGPQDPTGSEVMHDVFFLTPTQWQAAADKSYNYIVVGTGFCALAFAKRVLKRKPKSKILLLERGPFFLPAHFQALPPALAKTLGGKSETFPWTVDYRTANGHDGKVRSSHGSVPFFGGRSTVWSTWCPKPNRKELEGWPTEICDLLLDDAELFTFADRLLRVQPSDRIDEQVADDIARAAVYRHLHRPVYGSLQQEVIRRLDGFMDANDAGITRIEAARLASSDATISGVDFLKYSVPGDLLDIKKNNPELDIKLDCVVRKIINAPTENGAVATALDTSAGVLPLNGAKLVLAMGALPPATLVCNSFPSVFEGAPASFSAHFITSITARLPRKHLQDADLDTHQVGALYIAGVAGGDYKRQFHIQLSIITDPDPSTHAASMLRYMPDVVASATEEQLKHSEDHVLFVCAVLGELDIDNRNNAFGPNPQDPDPTTNSLLRVESNTDKDKGTWNAMDEATYAVLKRIAREASKDLEYWQPGENGEWGWKSGGYAIRVPDLVHESSTLPIGNDKNAKVDLNYKLKGTTNVYVTGASLWPRGGSWNPTLTMVALAADLADKLTSPQH